MQTRSFILWLVLLGLAGTAPAPAEEARVPVPAAPDGFMLTRIDGSYDIRSILKMSPMPQIDAQILFWKLERSGHVAL